jgi:hypothetical protein
MDSSTLSQAADLIVVFCFAAIIGATAGNILAKLICWTAEKIVAFVRKRKTEKTE